MLQEITNIFHRPRNKISHRILQHAKRSNDAIIILRQDNQQHSLKIEALNLLAIKMLGYENEEIVEHDFSLIMTDSTNQMIFDNLEFDDHGSCIDSVINRVAHIKIKTKTGAEVPVKIKIIRSLSSVNVARFQVVMNDSSLMESLEANRTIYRALLQGEEIFDKKTGLLTKQSIIADMELISHYSERNPKESSFVVYKFTNYASLCEQHGSDGALNMKRTLIKTIESTKRTNDIVGTLGSGAIIVLLPETPKDNIKIAITRIYDKLPQELKHELKISYEVINSDTPVEAQLENTLNGSAQTF